MNDSIHENRNLFLVNLYNKCLDSNKKSDIVVLQVDRNDSITNSLFRNQDKPETKQKLYDP